MFASMSVVGPYLQLFLKLKGYAPVQIGVLLGAYEIAGVLGPLSLGAAADRNGAYVPLLALAVVGGALSFLSQQFITGLAPAVLCILFMGFFYKSSIPLTDALASHFLPDPTHQYGKVRVMGSIGFVFCSVLFPIVGFINANSKDSILIMVSATSALHAGALFFLPKSTGSKSGDMEQRPAYGFRLPNFEPVFWIGIAAIFFGFFGMSSYYSFFSLYLQESLGISQVSYIWALGTFCEIPFIFFSGYLIKRFGLVRMFYVSFLAMIIRLSLFALVPKLVVVLPAQIFHGFTFGVFHTASVAFINANTIPERRALGMGLYISIGCGLSAFLGSALGGFVVEHAGFRGLFLCYAAAPLLSCMILSMFKNRFRDPVSGKLM